MEHFRSVPLGHRIVWNYCEEPTLIGGRIYDKLTIPIVERLVEVAYPFYNQYHHDYLYEVKPEWHTVGVFDIPALSEAKHDGGDETLDLGISGL